MTSPLPPRQHGVRARELARHAGRDGLWLPVCASCGRASYPPRELCGHCLSCELPMQLVASGATLLATSLLHHSNEAFFASSLPIRIGSVRLDAGPVAIVFLDGETIAPGIRVEVSLRLDLNGGAVLVAQAPRPRAAARPPATA